MNLHQLLPSGTSTYFLNMAIEILDLPFKNGDCS